MTTRLLQPQLPSVTADGFLYKNGLYVPVESVTDPVWLSHHSSASPGNAGQLVILRGELSRTAADGTQHATLATARVCELLENTSLAWTVSNDMWGLNGNIYYVGPFAELAVEIQVTAVSGGTSPTVTPFAIRAYPDGTNYGGQFWTAGAAVPATVNSKASYSIGSGGGYSLGRYMTMGLTLAGSPSSVTVKFIIWGKS